MIRGVLPLLLALSACASSPAATSDAAVDTAFDNLVDTSTVCEAACRTQSLEAQFGSVTAAFERSVFGITSPAKSSSKQWELHVEAVHGGAPGCPSSTSPTPERTLVIAGLPRSFSAPRSYADGVRATLLDFKGALTMEPLLRATAVTAMPRASTDDYLAFELDAEFGGGRIKGHLYATHCASMDEL